MHTSPIQAGRAFSGSHAYSTTQMQYWRVSKSNILVSCDTKRNVCERSLYEVSITDLRVLHGTSSCFAYYSAGISVQQVRNYKSLDLLPAASRSKSSYRLYTQSHLAAPKTARGLVGGYGRPLMPMAVEKRREELTWTSWRCIEALACFQRYVHEFCGELLARDSLLDGIQWGDFP